MRHLLAARRGESDALEVPREYEINEAQAEALLDDGVVALCELHSADDLAVYHVEPEFASIFGGDLQAMWGEVEQRICAAARGPSLTDGSHVLVIGDDVKLRPLSPSEAERLEEEGVVYPDKYFRGRDRTLYHVDPAFERRLAPGEDVGEAIEQQLDTVPCRRQEPHPSFVAPSHASTG